VANTAPGRRGKTKPDTAANIGIEAKLWAAAAALRNNMDAAEYKHAELEAQKKQGADPEDGVEYRCTDSPSAGARVKAIDFETSGHNAGAQT
jgi:hypothetical protein